MSGQASLRQDLLDRVRRLPADRLPDLDRCLHTLECGDLSPLLSSVAHKSDILPPAPEGHSQSGDKPLHPKDWPHAPLHRLSEYGTYIVTAGTLHKEHYLRGAERLGLFESILLGRLKAAGWQLEAWAVFSNHYHFVAHALEKGQSLSAAISRIHSETAREINRLDGDPGRHVWHNFWETQLTFEKSYLARLNYVHHNPVKHGLVRVANQYRWCSAAWFERTATAAQVKTVYSFKTDRLRLDDDFRPLD